MFEHYYIADNLWHGSDRKLKIQTNFYVKFLYMLNFNLILSERFISPVNMGVLEGRSKCGVLFLSFS